MTLSCRSESTEWGFEGGPSDEGPSLEGRVLDKISHRLDFSDQPRVARPAATEESVLFVAPAHLHAHASDEDIEVSDLDSDVWIGDLVRFEPCAATSLEESELSQTAGGHWLAPLRTLSDGDVRLSGDWTSSLPTLSLGVTQTRRQRASLEEIGASLAGRSTAARATRLGLALAVVFSVIAAEAAGVAMPTQGVWATHVAGEPAAVSAAPGRKAVVSAPHFQVPQVAAVNEPAPGLVFDALSVRVVLPRPKPPEPMITIPGKEEPVQMAAGHVFGAAPTPGGTEVAGL